MYKSRNLGKGKKPFKLTYTQGVFFFSGDMQPPKHFANLRRKQIFFFINFNKLLKKFIVKIIGA